MGMTVIFKCGVAELPNAENKGGENDSLFALGVLVNETHTLNQFSLK